MITQSESGLAQALYEAIRDGNGQLTRQYLIQRRNLVFDTQKSTGLADTRYFDVVADSTYIYLAYLAGRDLKVRRFVLSTQLWENTYTVSATANMVAPSFGDANTLYFVDTSGDVQQATTSNSWATSSVSTEVDVSVAGLSAIYELGGLTAQSVVLAEYRSDYNTRFHYVYDSTVVSSDIYWPHRITGLDGLHVPGSPWDKDLFVFSSVLPYQFGLRARGSAVLVEALERSGVIAFTIHSQGATCNFSDHYIVDEFDDSGPHQNRKYPRLSLINNELGDDKIACVVFGYDGNENYHFGAHRVSFSCDGKYWELEQLYPLSGCGSGAALVRAGNYAYLVAPSSLFISDSTEIVGRIPSQVDVTERVVSHSVSHQGLRGTTLMLKNDGDWLSSSIMTNDGTYSLITKLGVFTTTGESSGSHLITVGHEIIDSIEPSEELPSEDVALICRDFGSLMTDRAISPHIRESETQVLGADNFWDNTGTGYGGLRHTAGIEGSWSVANNVLKLRSTNKTGLALSTFDTSMWCGSISARVMWATNGNDELVGLVFREFDKDNHYRVVYDQGADALKISEIRAKQIIWTEVSTAMSWTLGNAYWLKIVFRYGLVKVYTSTDGATWTFKFEKVIPGQEPTLYLADVTGIPIESGGAGYTGKGYSAEDTWDDWGWDWDIDNTDWNIGDGGIIFPRPDTPTPEGSGIKTSLGAVNRYHQDSGHLHYGILLAATELNASVSWSTVMEGLPKVYGSYWCPTIARMFLDPFNPGAAYVFLHNDGILPAHGAVYYNPNWRNNGTWVSLVTWQNIIDNTTLETTDLLWIDDALVSFGERGLVYFHVGAASSTNVDKNHIVRVENYGASVSYSPQMQIVAGIDTTIFGFGISIALGHVNANKLWVMAQKSASQTDIGYFTITWPTFVTQGGYWTETTVQLTGKEAVPHFFLNPYFKFDGSLNDDLEIYRAGTAGTGDGFDRIAVSPDGWNSVNAFTAIGDTPYQAVRDRFDVPGKVNMRAWWRGNGTLKVLKTTNLALVTSYTLPTGAGDGFTLHWPYNPGQYYVGSGWRAPSGALLHMTLDADSESWVDLTGNMWSFLSRVGQPNLPESAMVVGFCPHWSEA